MSHTTHTEWVRAAIRDYLGLTDEGGTVTLDSHALAGLAEEARKAALNWVVAAANNGQIPHACGKDCDHGSTGNTEGIKDQRPADPA